MIKKIEVCNGKTCCNRGAEHIMNELKKQNKGTELRYCACPGFCEQGPNVVIDDEYIIHEANVPTIVEKIEKGDYKKIDKPTFEEILQNDFLGF